MKLNIMVDLAELFVDDCGTTVDELIKETIKNDIHNQLRKSEEYKLFIKKQTDIALSSITEKLK